MDSQTRIKIRTHLQSWNAKTLKRDIGATATPDNNVSDIISMMTKNNMGEIPVMEGRKYLGVVSRNFLLKRRYLPLSTKARTILVKNPTMEDDSSVIDMAEKFVSTNARQLFVLSNGEMSGMISREDVVNIIPKVPELAKIKTQDFMREDVIFVNEKDSVSKAVEIMEELDAPVVPVVDSHLKLQGFLGIKNLYNVKGVPTERTTVGDKIGQSIAMNIEVGSIMSKPPKTLDLSQNLGEAVNKMLDHSVSSLIAIDDDNMAEGIITIYDVLHLLASLNEKEQVYVQISGLGGEESFYLDDVYMEVEDFVDRVKNIEDLYGIDMHYDVYKKGGDNKKFSARGRIMTNKGVYHSKATDWSPSKVASDVFYHLERQIKTNKDIRIARRYKDR